MNFRKIFRPILVLLAFCGSLTYVLAERPATPGAGSLKAMTCDYVVEAGLDGEIYPVFANYASLQKQGSRSFAVIAITVNNPGQATVHQKIAVELPGWSDREIQLVEAEPGKRKTLMFAPSFLPRFYQNREIVAATA